MFQTLVARLRNAQFNAQASAKVAQMCGRPTWRPSWSGCPGCCGDLRVTIRAWRAVVRPRPWPTSWSHPLDRKVSVAEDFWDFCFCCKKRTETCCYCLGESKRSGIKSFFFEGHVWKPFRNPKQMNLRSRSEVWTRCWWMTLGMWPSPTMVPPSWSNWRWNIQQPRCW